MADGRPQYTLPHPDDLSEQSRLDLQHQNWLLHFNGALQIVPVKNAKGFTVLDAGCGSGAWALAFANEYPEAQVVAVDINKPTISTPPRNCSFTAADLEQDWSFAQADRYDFIHVRMMTYAIKDWPAFFSRCYQRMKPGAWIEVTDVRMPLEARNPVANPMNSPFLHFGAIIEQAWTRLGWNGRACDRHGDRLTSQGFANHAQQEYYACIGDWPETEPDRTIGRNAWNNWSGLMSKMGPGLLTKALQMSEQDAEQVKNDMLEDLKRNGGNMGYYFPERVNVAQKPEH